MSSLEKRAWLALWSMCPAYCVYFAIQIWWPTLFTSFLERIACLAVVASVHAVGYVAGLLVIKRRERGEHLFDDERDRAIDGRATRTAYFILLTGMIVVGMVMPFSDTGWKLVNTALLSIVLAETVRYALIVIGYRRPRLAY
jgi:uncharacterized membrane protein